MFKSKRKDKTILEQDILKNALKFTDFDLSINRAGRLSDQNVDYLRQRRVRYIAVFVVAAVIASVVLPIRAASWYTQIACMVIPLIAAVLVGAYNVWRSALLTFDMRDGLVEAAQGIVYLRIMGGNYTGYVLRVGDLRFTISHDVYRAFTDRDPYTIYYAPNSRTLLAAEPLRTD